MAEATMLNAVKNKILFCSEWKGISIANAKQLALNLS